MNKRQVGTVYEGVAADYLTARGYQILERNFRCRTGEIDIIAEEDGYLCFIEVKYRAGAGYGSPFEAVTVRKQKKIIATAQYYMQQHGYGLDQKCRFDVVAIQRKNVILLQNAFGAGNGIS